MIRRSYRAVRGTAGAHNPGKRGSTPRPGILLLALALLAAPAWAEVKFTGPTAPVPTYTLARFALADAETGAAVWIVSPDEGVDELTSEDGRRFAFVAPPGRYSVYPIVFRGDRPDKGKAVVVILPPPGPVPPPTPIPDPTPGPTPDPAPTPPPATGHVYVSYVTDAAAPTPQQAEVGTRASFRIQLKDLDASWWAYQSDEEDVGRLNLLVPEKVRKAGLPVAIFHSKDGIIHEVLPAPTEESIMATMRRLRGKP